MKRIAPSPNKEQWPRQKVGTVETRKRDLVVRVSDWTRDKDEPAYDVEVYVGGVYDWNESEVFSVGRLGGKAAAKRAAIAFAQKQIERLL